MVARTERDPSGRAPEAYREPPGASNGGPVLLGKPAPSG
jgi:hypothetical protein